MDTAARAVATRRSRSDGARDLDLLEHLDLVADLHVVVVLDRDAALGPGLDLVDVILEAPET